MNLIRDFIELTKFDHPKVEKKIINEFIKFTKRTNFNRICRFGT